MRFFIAPGATSAAKRCSTWRGKQIAILPELRTHDRFGNRIDVVEFHPAYHELMGLIYGTQAHSFAWTHRDERGAHVARAALSYMWNQGENGICCPMGMTFASIPALQHDKGLYDEWVPQILKATYDDRPIYAKEEERHHGRHGDD